MSKPLKEHIQGNTFKDKEFRLKINGDVVDITGASILMEFKNPLTGEEKTMTSAVGGGLEINDPTDGVFRIKKQIIDWPTGQWKYAVTYTLSNGDVATYIYGILPIIDKP